MTSLRITPGLLYTAGAIWPPVCVAVVAARFLTRRGQRARLGWDDWLVLPALVLVIGMAAAILAGTALKALGHPTPIPAAGTALTATTYQQTVTRKLYWIITLLQTAALCFIKSSCVLFYRRVFRTGVGRAIDATTLVLLAIVVIWGVSFFFGFLFICRLQFGYLWGDVEESLKCASTSMIDQAVSISDVIMDIIIMLFPIPLVWRLQMSTVNKICVTIVFFLGTLTIAMSITRMVIILEELSVEFAKTADEDFVSTDGLYFMFIEACFGLCTICLPTLSGALKLKGVQTFIEGFSSLLSRIQRSRDTSRGSTERHERSDSQERLGSRHSGSGRYHSDTETKSSRNIELQDRKAIRVTKSFGYTQSMA